MSQPAPHRHEPLLKIASGGMATVFLGSLQGALGFRQIVAIKRPHPHLLENDGFRDELLREARLASGIHHANVVDVRDVEVVGDSIQLVMDYIEGASLSELEHACTEQERRVPPAVALRIVLDACAGLHAAHELTDDAGRPLGLVHRDVSPQNILIGVDGLARVTDFGIAKCAHASDRGSSSGSLKGKIGYMAPEYVHGQAVDRRADVFALGVVLWEALCGKRLFRGQSDGETLERVLSASVPRVSEVQPELAAFDAVVVRALRRERTERFATTEALAEALERAGAGSGPIASHAEVGRFVREMVGGRLEERRRALRDARQDDAPASVPPSASAPSKPSSSRSRAFARPAQPPGDTLPEGRLRRRSHRRFAWLAAIGFVLAGSAVFAVGRARFARHGEDQAGTAATMAPLPATPTPTLTPTPTPTPTPTATPTPTPTPTPTATATATATATPSHVRPRVPARATPKPSSSHEPPPNPYPSPSPNPYPAGP